MDFKAIQYTSFWCISLVFLVFLKFNSCTAHYDPLLIMASRQLIAFRSKIPSVLLLMKIDKDQVLLISGLKLIMFTNHLKFLMFSLREEMITLWSMYVLFSAHYIYSLIYYPPPPKNPKMYSHSLNVLYVIVV